MGGNYSAWQLLKQAAGLAPTRQPAWPKTVPKKHYRAVIVGGGAHGLATAYYLARDHGIRDVLVVEAGWLGGGNTARNTTIIRSDYFLEASGRLKEFALQLWEGLSQELNYNLMVSQRGYVDLAHSDGELEAFTLRANAMLLRGSDAQILDRAALQKRVPQLNLDPGARFPIAGALLQERGGTLRHDAVAWAYARAACRLGVAIVENCPVTGFEMAGGRIKEVVTARGTIAADHVVVSVAGQSSRLAAMAGLTLPLEPIPVQAFVSEPTKPALDVVVNFNAGLAYVSQSDKGELVMGGGTEGYAASMQKGSHLRIEEVVARVIEMFPFVAKMRLMRQWAGIADIPMDGNAIMGPTPVANLTINAGWGYAGFKATPAVGWTLAHTIATGRTHPLIAPFTLARFETGALIDDAGAGPAPHLH